MESLRKKSEFTKVYFKGKRLNTKHLTLFVLEDNPIQELKLGIVVKKKLGSSVKRNRLRRLLKNSFRMIEKKIYKGLAVLAVFRPLDNLDPFSLNVWNIKNEIKNSLLKAGILKEQC